MKPRLADMAAGVVFAGVLTCWVQGYWPVALVEIGAFLAAGIWLAWVTIARQRIPGGFVLFPVCAGTVCGILQLAAGRSAYRFETGKALLGWAACASVFLVTREVCSHTPERNRLIRSALWFGAAVSLLTVVQYVTSEGKVFWLFPTEQERVLGPFLYKNQCAAFLELVFPLAVYQLLVDRRQPLLYVAMAAAMFAAAIAAVSRAGVLIVVSELIAILLFARFRELIPPGKLWKTMAWAAGLCVVLAAVVGWQVTLQKFREPEPYRVRHELLLSSLAMMADRPWTGFGLGTWPAVYPAYARFDNGLAANHAHNDWAEWAAEGGLPFAALLAMLAIWSVRPAVDSLWGIGVPAVFVHSLVDYPLREPIFAEHTGIRYRGQRTDTSTFSPHSQILQAWFEAGILGAAFFLYLGWKLMRGFCWCVFRRLPDVFSVLFAFCLLRATWHLLFSPFAGLARLDVALAAVVVCLLDREQRHEFAR